MNNLDLNNMPYIPEMNVNAKLDFQLNGWPAAASLMTLCISGVLIYGLHIYGQNS